MKNTTVINIHAHSSIRAFSRQVPARNRPISTGSFDAYMEELKANDEAFTSLVNKTKSYIAECKRLRTGVETREEVLVKQLKNKIAQLINDNERLKQAMRG